VRPEDHINTILNLLNDHPLIVKVEIISQFATDEERYVRLIAYFINGSELHLFEYIIKGRVEKYAYHLQDIEGKMILRYDNRPHHPEVETFPHHKHISSNSHPLPSRKPTLNKLLAEASRYI